MNSVRYLTLIAAVPMLLAATCVTGSRQRGPTGPWVVDVVNTGSEAVNGDVEARISDANGREIGLYSAFACPKVIEPGRHGAAEIFAAWGPDAALPFHAKLVPIALAGPESFVQARLSARVVERHPDRRFALVEIRNGSTELAVVDICAVLRSPTGEALEVGRSEAFPSLLRPGQASTLPIFFNAMPPGDIELFPWGAANCCSNFIVVDAPEFVISASRVTRGPAGRALVVAGEMRNRSGLDLASTHLAAYATGAPETRVDVRLGCDGIVPFGAAGAASFAIPLSDSVTAGWPVVVAIEANESSPEYMAPVTDVSFAQLADQADGLATYAVHATVRNAAENWLNLSRGCATLRDVKGVVVGVAPLQSLTGYYPLIGPGQSLDLNGVTFVVGTPVSATVQATGQLGPPPVMTAPQP